jgi:hypothetical protein
LRVNACAYGRFAPFTATPPCTGSTLPANTTAQPCLRRALALFDARSDPKTTIQSLFGSD